ncbi:TPA: hypothetical protein I8271_003746 [Kluyvera intermedia]|uniref:Uncharacterized protein n=1 Tax=Kluyvera intermedia TaxID=61648 RepID=A0A9P3T9Z7_KLUIN|nr:hypothetical protein [Kluyvera intermedia]HAT2514070.1 hypothetical protein [Kluyvera intermedia]HAT2681680.1 hypothetical protein [Kluyvera intermedia]HAT2698350.1 hypothetical protein [Kluyvera intermedia]HAT2709007.1 hypothetical protein [Kluyvera intermedia]
MPVKARYLIVIGAFILSIIGGLSWSAFHYSDKAATAESENRVLKSDNALQGQVIATQAFNINRFNKTAETAARANAIVAGNSETTVIKYREILRRDKTCDLPVPDDIAGGLLEYTNRLRAGAMHTDSTGPDSADGGSTPASGLTYCQAVLWIEPLLATIEQGNNNFAGIRDIEQQRQKPTEEKP